MRHAVKEAYRDFSLDLRGLLADYAQLARLETEKVAGILLSFMVLTILGLVFLGNGFSDLIRALSADMVNSPLMGGFRALFISGMIQMIIGLSLVLGAQRKAKRLLRGDALIAAKPSSSKAGVSKDAGSLAAIYDLSSK